MGELVNVKVICERLKLTETTIYKLAMEEVIPGFKVGKSWRFDLEEVEQAIQKAKEASKAKIIPRRPPAKKSRKRK